MNVLMKISSWVKFFSFKVDENSVKIQRNVSLLSSIVLSSFSYSNLYFFTFLRVIFGPLEVIKSQSVAHLVQENDVVINTIFINPVMHVLVNWYICKVCVQTFWPKWPALYSGFCDMKWLGVFLPSLDGIFKIRNLLEIVLEGWYQI